MPSSDTPEWGLKCAVTPRFGARLVQEGHRLHYLADRASIVGTFSKTEAQNLERCFPELIKQLEQKLRTGELNPRQQGGACCIATNGLVKPIRWVALATCILLSIPLRQQQNNPQLLSPF